MKFSMFIENVLELLTIAVQFSIIYSCTETNIRNLKKLDLRGPNITTDFLAIGNRNFLSDDKLPAGWYRTVYNGWQYTMSDVNNFPDIATCSTFLPIYLLESHPPIYILTEDPFTLKACISGFAPCTKPTNIQVRKCQEEIQYYLEGTSWYNVYCFEQKYPLTIMTIPAPAPNNVNFGKVVVSPELNFITYERDFMTEYKPYIIFRCKFDNQVDMFYSVNWYVDNKRFYETLGPTKNLTELTLHEDILVFHKITLPIQLRCGISASSNHDGLKTPEVFSLQFYAGMKILNKNISMDKGSSGTVEMVSTIPLGCHYFYRTDSTMPVPCFAEVKVFVDNKESFNCSRFSSRVLFPYPHNAEYDSRMCTKYIKTYTVSEKWEPDTVNFTFVTSDHTYEDNGEFILKLEMGNFGHKLWEDYYFPDVKIYVEDTDLYKNKVCQDHSEVMYTFDGYTYYQRIEGTFVLYLNVKYGIEVQRTVKCSLNSFPRCITCGVAVSAGQDIFIIHRCGNEAFLGFTQCGDGGILDVVRVHDTLYQVFTPIGTIVTVKIPRYWVQGMSVKIYLAPKDIKNVFGLCGYADGDKTNDLRHSNSSKVSPLGKASLMEIIHHDFINSWKIEHPKENLFQPTFKERPKWSQQNGLYCMCDSRVGVDREFCSPTQSRNCKKRGSITEMKCHVTGRVKRNTGDHSDKEIRRLLHKMTPINRRQKVSNDTFLADVHIEAVNNGVKNMMDLQSTYVKTNTKKDLES